MIQASFLNTVGISVVSDAYTRVINQILSTKSGMDEKAAIIQAVCDRIESAIQAQNQAHAKAAKMALTRGDTSRALECYEMAIAQDPIDAEALVLYASLLFAQGKKDIATNVLSACAEWFGADCTVLPQEIRSAYKSNDSVISVENADGYCLRDLTLHPPSNWWSSGGEAGVSNRGVAAVFENRPTFRFSDKFDVVVKFHPIEESSSCLDVFGSKTWPGQNICGTVIRTGSCLTAMTDRFIVIGDSQSPDHIAIDMQQGFRHIKTNLQTIRRNFGERKYGVWDSCKKENPRSVIVNAKDSSYASGASVPTAAEIKFSVFCRKQR